MGLPGEVHAGERTEVLGFLPGELAAEILLAAAPEETERFGSLGEGEATAAHEFRGQNFEEVRVGLFVDVRDCAGAADAVDERFPLFVVGRGTCSATLSCERKYVRSLNMRYSFRETEKRWCEEPMGSDVPCPERQGREDARKGRVRAIKMLAAAGALP
jgi:hypothetical protein